MSHNRTSHPRVSEALTRYLNSSPNAVVLQHVIAADHDGDCLFVYLEQDGVKRLAVRRITPSGGTVEVRLRPEEITAAAMAVSEFRLRVGGPLEDDRRGRRGAR